MNNWIRATVTAALLTATSTAQGASFTFFGSASGDTFTGQHLAVTGLPQVGTSFTLEVQYATPPGIIIYSSSVSVQVMVWVMPVRI